MRGETERGAEVRERNQSERRHCRMKSKNVEALIQENEDLRDLLEDLIVRIQEFREEIQNGLDDLEDLVTETSGIRFH